MNTEQKAAELTAAYLAADDTTKLKIKETFERRLFRKQMEEATEKALLRIQQAVSP